MATSIHMPDTPSSPFLPDYSRQVRLQGVGDSGQQKLIQSRVLVIGAGGLGNVVLPLLAGAGVGVITVVDYDRLEVSNLHRQTLYCLDDIGAYKAELAVNAIKERNPSVEATSICRKLVADELLEAISGYDLVLECSDDFQNKLMVNDAAVLLNKPVVFANAVQREGQLQTYAGHNESACMRCLWTELPENAMTCEQTGVLGSVPAMLGAMQATEALQWLLQGDESFFYQSLENRVLYYDASNYRQRIVNLPQSEGCPLHSSSYNQETFFSHHNPVAESPLEYKGTFAEAVAAGFEVVDLRDAVTVSQQPLPVASKVIAADQLLASPDVDLEGHVLLVCYRGRTSLSVASRLREMGYERICSKAGGAEGSP